MPATKPQDHKIKSVDELEEYFSFKIGDQRYVMPLKTKDVLTPGWVRRNRRRDEVDYFMTVIESLVGLTEDTEDMVTDDERKQGTEIIKVLDGLDWNTHRKIQRELGEHLGATLGE